MKKINTGLREQALKTEEQAYLFRSSLKSFLHLFLIYLILSPLNLQICTFITELLMSVFHAGLLHAHVTDTNILITELVSVYALKTFPADKSSKQELLTES